MMLFKHSGDGTGIGDGDGGGEGGGVGENHFFVIAFPALEGSTVFGSGGEGEGITVLEMEDGTLFHALDIGALFIDSNLRHYRPVEEK